MGSTFVRTCDWPMPRVLRTDGFLVHIHGCALTVSRANLTLLATVDVLGKPFRTVWGTEHRQIEHPDGLMLSVDGGACAYGSRVEVNLLRYRCGRVPRAAKAIRVRAVARGSPPSAAVAVPLRTLRVSHAGLHCSSTALYGHMPTQGARLRAAHAAWASLGLGQTLAFARSPEDCCAATGDCGGDTASRLLCVPRQQMTSPDAARARNASGAAAVGVYFDQKIHLALCLLYAQLGRAALLAAADTDELPTPGVGDVLAQLPSERRVAGALFFFDSALRCPADLGCPSSEEDFERRCPHPPTAKRRTHTKPVVVPARVSSLSIHRAKPRPGLALLRSYDPCLRHLRFPRCFAPDMESFKKTWHTAASVLSAECAAQQARVEQRRLLGCS